MAAPVSISFSKQAATLIEICDWHFEMKSGCFCQLTLYLGRLEPLNDGDSDRGRENPDTPVERRKERIRTRC